MKKKFSLWLNVATICLCVCAIAIGVYAAQSATLTVTGSIGFTANGIKYSAKVEALGYVTDPDNVNTYQSTLVELTKVTDATESKTLSLTSSNEKLYFTDLKGDTVPNIEIKITVTNNSKFDITVAPNTQSCTDVTINKTAGDIATKNGGEASITYTLSLNKDDTTKEYKELTSVDNLSISIKLDKKVASIYKTDTNDEEIVVNKYTPEEQAETGDIYTNTVGYAIKNYNTYAGYVSGTSKSYAQEFPYYITMGKSSTSAETEDIKWLIVGTIENKTITALTTEELTRIEETRRLLKDKTYVALSAEALETRRFHSTTSSTNGIYANDYYQSAIRTYLTSVETSGFAATYSLTGINIVERAVSELYADIDKIDSVTSGKSTITESNKESDSFWLLSQAEVYTLFKINEVGTKYYSSASIATVKGKTTPCWWWLRSPSSGGAHYVSVEGRVDVQELVIDSGAVRAAFQF